MNEMVGKWLSWIGIVAAVIGFFYASVWMGGIAVILGLVGLATPIKKLAWLSIGLGIIAFIIPNV
ncbi:hypothetical protein I8J29_04675 [Paenibacillus sp. MWE-103]|uniref:C4-dicarboxylate ABC transporter n=1 Tax=Paenibacillus artemisiicola TaxID=1172618 RepID=A0ABS3W5A6_9BACL|nr:hypothetical protein [Paenibacillus artemisiicola]MBO7743476.1 hypothetical protein [Paenibacillus artemisiicola]